MANDGETRREATELICYSMFDVGCQVKLNPIKLRHPKPTHNRIPDSECGYPKTDYEVGSSK